MWKLLVVLLGSLAGCIQPSLVLCSDDLACPVSDRCDEAHHACVSPDQLAVCRDARAGDDCAAGPISGGCFDGVCLRRGCGNRVTEPGEMCDDGNQRSGDGCTGDCRSTEICGNGVVDPGEQCDDGDLMSRDGCDSRCLTEQAAWSDVIAITPSFIDAANSAYDAARGLLTYVSARGTWEWDGQQWAVTPHAYLTPDKSAPDHEPSSESADVRGHDVVFYDPDRQRVAAIARDGAGAVHVYSWIKPSWVQFDHGPGGPIVEDDLAPGRISVAYDVAAHRLILIAAGVSDTSRVWAVDATGAWSDLPSLPGAPNELTGAYDVASGQLVLESESGVEWIFDGAGWSSVATPFGPKVSVVVDAGRGRLVLVDNQSQLMYERIGSAWQALDDAACGGGEFSGLPPLYYDPFNATIVRFSGDAARICSWDGGWSERVPAVPRNPVGATFDPLTRELVVFTSVGFEDASETPIEMWRWTGERWRQIEALHMPAGRLDPLVVYSTGRAATVVYNEPPYACEAPCEAAGTWSVIGPAWTRIAPLPTADDFYARGMTYDPANQRVLLLALDAVWSLGDTEHTWVRLDITPPTGWISGASWHARHEDVIVLGQFEGAASTLFEMRDASWAAVGLIPASLSTYDNAMTSSERSGGTIMIDRTSGTSWEYVDTSWIALPRAPMATLSAAWAAYDPVDGSLYLAGKAEDGFVASVLGRSSATPLESCVAGEDVDGDGLAGCDDLDCYWACPRCRPHTSCL